MGVKEALAPAADALAKWTGLQPSFMEIGFPGARAYLGRFNEEYLAELTGPQWFAVVDKMRRSDGLIQAIESALTLPLRSASWKIVANGGRDAQGIDHEVSEFIQNNLFGGMKTSFDDVLRNTLLYLFYGFVVSEQLWEVDSVTGKIKWLDIRPRKPSTRWRWERIKPSGEYGGWYQQGYAVDEYRTNVFLPAKKSLRFTCREEYGLFDGISVLRGVYKHWMIRDALYQTLNLGVERNLLGIPVGKYPNNTIQKRIDSAETALRNYTTGKAAFLLLPEGFEAEVTRGDGSFLDAIGYLNHHSNMMVTSVLADFLILGQQSIGSYALSDSKTDLFQRSLNAIAKQICDVFNVAIKQLCDWNWPNLEGYPKLACDRIVNLNMVEVTQALLNATSAQVLTPGVTIEEWVREEMALPAIPDEQVKKRLDYEDKNVLTKLEQQDEPKIQPGDVSTGLKPVNQLPGRVDARK